jgi:hypothetical protein
VSGDSPEWTALNKQIESFDKKDSPARQQLINMFGPVAMAELLESDSPYITTGLSAPEFEPFFAPAQDIVRLKAYANDPSKSPEKREEAKRMLLEDFGISM